MFFQDLQIQWRSPETGNSHHNIVFLVDCDEAFCTNCTNCKYCTNCIDCKYCANCKYCTDCIECTNCKECTNCTDCIDCKYCTDCIDCTDCGSQPIQLNLYHYIITIRKNKTMKIGCKDYCIDDWKSFTRDKLGSLDGNKSKEFLIYYGDLIRGVIDRIPESFWKGQ